MCHNNNWHTLWSDRHSLINVTQWVQVIWPSSNASHDRLDFQPCWNNRALCSLLPILLCFEFVPPQNLLYVCFCFANYLARSWPFLRITSYFIYQARYFFQSENFCRTFGPALWCSDCPTNFDSTVTYTYCVRHPVCIHENRRILSRGLNFRKMYLCILVNSADS